MIRYFRTVNNRIFAVDAEHHLAPADVDKLLWLFDNAEAIHENKITGPFLGPRKEMITPWSTNAVEITQNMGIEGIKRIEQFTLVSSSSVQYDPMLQDIYPCLDQSVFQLEKAPESVQYIEDIHAYNQQEGLALSEEEIRYLEDVSNKLGRMLTDSEIFGFSQVNSEHCRHKIFNGIFYIDNAEQNESLFQMIRRTTEEHPNQVVSAYKDNCAFLKGPPIEQFAPRRQDIPDYFNLQTIESVISLKAETHNFPTTVEPFNGAATGTGGEIRDRIGGGKGAFPIAGTAVYMTSYTRLQENRSWEQNIPPRNWLYHPPDDILIKASNGASDFGNKFGQPLICGSVLTFEHKGSAVQYGYDKVIMLAGGIGYGNKRDSVKELPQPDDTIVLMGGDNYRIGMGGSAVSSVSTGEYGNAIELNAVQRSNPEMQKRIYNAIRALSESLNNPVVSIHDHGAGGHLNCFSELVEDTGGTIHMEKLPIGDPTLSAKEVAGNESQERMGLVINQTKTELLSKIAERERAPVYMVGKITGDHQFTFINNQTGEKPIDLNVEDLFGNPPKTILTDQTLDSSFEDPQYQTAHLEQYIREVLQLESVACKDYLTNKADRSVTGRVAKQQTVGEIQLPLNNVGIITLDYRGVSGVATAIGHAPAAGLVDESKGSILSIAESLTNIMWAPIQNGLKGVSLSANWMWPCKNPGENARLYRAVSAAGNFARALGINIPTGKDSLSMTQKYPDGTTVRAPGTVIISAGGEVTDVTQTVEPVLQNEADTEILYIDLSSDTFKTGGSSLGQVLRTPGSDVPTIKDAEYFSHVFNHIQQLIADRKILAGHDISAGGMITALLEMNFPNTSGGADIALTAFNEKDPVKILLSENPGILIQTKSIDAVGEYLRKHHINAIPLGHPSPERKLTISRDQTQILNLSIDEFRDIWYHTSFLLDGKQSGQNLARERYHNYKQQPLKMRFPDHFTGLNKDLGTRPHNHPSTPVKAGIIREKGVNGDREMAYSMYLAGMEVKDIHMTDLINGRETLDDIHMIVFVGGFSNSDVLGSAKGWAGAFLYNPKAKAALDRFYNRPDTLTLGICNGCQLMLELNLISPDHSQKPVMELNDTGKFESAFLNVDIQDNDSIMLQSLASSRLGIWIAHGEGKFHLPFEESAYHIPLKYSYSAFPGNPNGSDYAAAALCSADGRHLAMMPHIERAIFPWQWAYYPASRKYTDEISPWIEAFVNAREWIRSQTD